MHKMLLVVYNEAIEPEVMELLDEAGIRNYTQFIGVYGRGESSGMHMGNDIWPGRNNMLIAVCGPDEARKALAQVSGLRKKLGKEGVKAFLVPVEEMT